MYTFLMSSCCKISLGRLHVNFSLDLPDQHVLRVKKKKRHKTYFTLTRYILPTIRANYFGEDIDYDITRIESCNNIHPFSKCWPHPWQNDNTSQRFPLELLSPPELWYIMQ